ncbi:fumarylacetoacetate hydrolase family protein [Nocardioides sp. NPDC126508]
MRVANVNGRAWLLTGDRTGVDINHVSANAFPTDVRQLLPELDRLGEWLQDQPPDTIETQVTSFELGDLGPVVTDPPQIFAIGLNYRSHKDETGYTQAPEPVIFTKYASSLVGPLADVVLSSDTVDWEAELVAVIGRPGRNIAAADAWEHVAGLCVGQDLSDRERQFAAAPPQFSMAKSFAGYSPIGPWLVTPDELADPSDIEIGYSVDGRVLQKDRTSNMILDIPGIIERLSRVVELRIGDLIFTGTPAGVGMGHQPPAYLRPGSELVTWAVGIGEIRQRMLES